MPTQSSCGHLFLSTKHCPKCEWPLLSTKSVFRMCATPDVTSAPSQGTSPPGSVITSLLVFFVSSIFLCVLVMRHIRDGKWLPFQHSLFGSRVTCLRVTIGSCRSLTMNGTCGTSSGFVVFRFRVTGCAETSVVCKPSVFTHVETISAMWRVCASREMRRMDTWKCGCLSTCICACAYAPVDAFCCRTA